MNIAMIVLNYNSYEETKKYINSIKDYEIINKIVIVDNQSTDGMFEKLKELQNEKIDVIISERNGGYSYGNNFGIKHLEKNNEKYDYIIISNSDIEIEENAIKQCVNELNANKDVVVTAPRMYYVDGPARRSSWKIRTYGLDIIHSTRLLELLFYPFLRKGEYSKKEYENDNLFVECISGAFFIIKYDVLKEIGYFDENVFLFYEEDILGLKLKKKGYKLCSVNKVKFIHYESKSIGKIYNVKNKLKLLDKSKRYYHITYNNVGNFRIAILEFLNFIRKLELIIEVPIRKLLDK